MKTVSLTGESAENTEIKQLKGKIEKMQNQIDRLQKRKRELKRMLPSGSQKGMEHAKF